MTEDTRAKILAAGEEAKDDARRLWGVTTLLDAGLKKEALIGWAAKMTAFRAYDDLAILQAFAARGDRAGALKWLTGARFDKSGKAKDRGTKVHKIIEAYAYGQQPKFDEEFRPYDLQIRKFLAEYEPIFQAAEAPVYNLTYGYAGTMDLILDIDGVRCIVDAKTTDKDPDDPDVRSLPPYPEVALQLCAYARAELIGTSPASMRYFNKRRYYMYDPALTYEPMIPVEGALALVVAPTFYRLVPFAIDDEVWAMWGYVRELARWDLEVKRRVQGPDITPPIEMED